MSVFFQPLTHKILPVEQIAVCPYDSSHTFQKHRLIYHLHRCKIGKKIGHLFRTCKFNPCHVVGVDEIQIHENRCQDGRKIRIITREIKETINTQRVWVDDQRILIPKEEQQEDISEIIKVEEGESSLRQRDQGHQYQEEQPIPSRMINVYGSKDIVVQGWGNNTDVKKTDSWRHKEQTRKEYVRRQQDKQILEMLLASNSWLQKQNSSIIESIMNGCFKL